MNIPTPYHSENGDGNMEPKLPSPFLRLHQVLEKNPTLASYISELCIFTHMQGSTFWMTENASEVAVALWMDILTLIDNHSLFICAFRMSASSPTYWSQINQNIRSMILKIWCKPTMKRIYLNNIRDLPRDLCGLKGACAGRLELHNFSFGSDDGEEDEDESFRDNRKPAGEDQVVVKNDGSPGIAELSVNLGSKEQLDSFLSAITYPSDATGLRGIRSLDLVFGLEDDLPATVSAVMLPMFLSLERLSLQWKKDTMRRSNDSVRFYPLNLAYLPNLQSIRIIFPPGSGKLSAPAQFLHGTFQSLLQPAQTLNSPQSSVPLPNKLQFISVTWTPHLDFHTSFTEVSQSLEEIYRQSKGVLEIEFYLDSLSITGETKEAWKGRFDEALEWGVRMKAVKVFR